MPTSFQNGTLSTPNSKNKLNPEQISAVLSCSYAIKKYRNKAFCRRTNSFQISYLMILSKQTMEQIGTIISCLPDSILTSNNDKFSNVFFLPLSKGFFFEALSADCMTDKEDFSVLIINLKKRFYFYVPKFNNSPKQLIKFKGNIA